MRDVSFLVPGGALTGPLFASVIEGEREPPLPNGTPIGQYRIAGVIGRGGSGIVYRAERSDGTFAQSVALKIVRADARLRDHLRRERAILAQLGHPGIARLFDGGETSDGEPWFAMELVSGRRIDQWCRANDASWRTRLRLLAEVCDAVQYAHARLLVHRDIKPSNILVDEDGFARLLDFGISVALHETQDEEAGHAFTPEFASPEQLAGAEVTTASDVYQLGRLVEALMDPERDGRGVQGLPVLARENLRAIAKRATASSPDARYASAADLKAALARVPLDVPAAGAPWSALRRAEFFLARHAVATAIGMVLGASLVVVAVHYTLALTAQRDRAEQSAQRAQVATDVLTSLFSANTGAADTPQQEAARAILDRGATNALARLADSPAQRAIAAETLARAYIDLGAGESARPALEATLAALDAQAPAWPRERARLELLLAQIAVARRALDETAARIGRADALLQALPDAERAESAAARIALIEQRGDPDAASDERQALIERLDGTAQARTPLFAQLLSERAQTRASANDYAGARADVERAHAILREHQGAMSAATLEMERRIAWFALRSGRARDADAIVAAQRASVGAAFGERSGEFAGVLNYEGLIAQEARRNDEALERFQRALVVGREAWGPSAERTSAVAHNVGDVLFDLGRPADALPYYRDALRARLERLPYTNLSVLVNRLQIARSECALGDHDSAARGFAEARGGMAARLSPGHPALVVAAALEVDCLLRQRRIADAGALFAREVPDAARARLHGRDAARVEAIRKALETAGADSPSM
jgi:eukaryotic-like serine/threonine-protein kinase